MEYTLTLTSLEFPVCRPHEVEAMEYVRQSAAELKDKGWQVEIRDIPAHVTDGHTYGPYQHIIAKRTLWYLDDIRNYWWTRLIGHEAEKIGVSFGDANIYRPHRGRESGVCYVMPNKTADELGYNWDCTVPDAVELFVNGGQQWGEANLEKFILVLIAWDRKFRIARKLKQLVGVAVSQNQGAIDRLQGEILEHVMAI